ncbi:hypothetical protein N9J53_02030 [Gammaproteobacteria bacterium]|nr:hypothetical protein [Gammaproteobacteria bacterium]
MIPVLIIRILFNSFNDKDYRSNFLNRFGIYNSKFDNSVWFHAVSLGEVISSAKIVNKILENHDVILTVSTPTGLREANKIFGSRLKVVYVPWDFILFTLGFFRSFNPKALILFETEIWPTMISIAYSKDIPIILSNARMSKKSFKNYKKINLLSKKIISKISIIYTQSNSHASRFEKLGALSEKIKSVGSVKFDIDRNAEETSFKNNKPFILAASTHAGEDEIIIDAYKKIVKENPAIGLVIAPRHPERAFAIKKLLDKSNLNARILEEVPIDIANKSIEIIRGTGMLRELYSKAQFAFVGGSLFQSNGGHNIIEPAFERCPFIVGPHMHNFQDILKLFVDEDACLQIDKNLDVLSGFKDLLNNNGLRENMSSKAFEICLKNKGSTDKQCSGIIEMINIKEVIS